MRAWLDPVVTCELTMSQRTLSSVERHGGEALLKAVAAKLGVHVVVLSGDQGQALALASREAFRVLI